MSAHDPLNPEESREDARRQALLESTQQASDIRLLMSEEWGRRLIWSWLEWGGVYRLSFAGSPEQTAFNEGNRNFGLMLLGSVMQHAPELAALMQTEAARAKEIEAARKEEGRDRGPFRRMLTRIRG